MMKSPLIALGALLGLSASQPSNPYLKRIKYAPRARNQGAPGDKLRRKAREGKLGIAVLK